MYPFYEKITKGSIRTHKGVAENFPRLPYADVGDIDNAAKACPSGNGRSRR